MKRLRVALLCGGRSSEREISLKGGEQVRTALPEERYEVVIYDPANDLAKLINDATNIDVALVILHGRYGEDGAIQGLLDLVGIPYQCSGILGSALAINKIIAKKLFRLAGLKVPKDMVLTKIKKYSPSQIINRLGLPLIVKPTKEGSTIGLSLVKREDELRLAIEKAFKYNSEILIEKYIAGREITGGILGNKTPIALPIIEIIPQGKHEVFDYEAKYSPGATKEICPAPLPAHLTKKAQQCALLAHKILRCKGFSRTDMILKDETIYVLETNTIPGMTEISLFPLAAKTMGLPFPSLLEKLIDLALETKND
jgi:D-alanine-D-alanine ligase